MKTRIKRLLALMTVLMMVLDMMPTYAFADVSQGGKIKTPAKAASGADGYTVNLYVDQAADVNGLWLAIEQENAPTEWGTTENTYFFQKIDSGVSSKIITDFKSQNGANASYTSDIEPNLYVIKKKDVTTCIGYMDKEKKELVYQSAANAGYLIYIDTEFPDVPCRVYRNVEITGEIPDIFTPNDQ